MVPELHQETGARRRPSQVFRKVVEPSALTPGSRTADQALIGLFLIMIALPLLGLVFGLDASFVLDENRTLADRPEFKMDRVALKGFPRKIENYFNDQFGFRKRLIYWLAIAKVKGLGVTSSPSVSVGSNGWLFLAGDLALQSYRSIRPFTQVQLEGYQRVFESRRDWLAARGIPYLVVILPHKDTIYPEFVPSSYNKVHPHSRLDQLMGHMKAHSTVPIIDVREEFLAAKEHERLYDFTDSHWNGRGAFLAYRRIAERLTAWLPGYRAMARSDLREVSVTGQGGDLARMLGIPWHLPEERLGLVPLVPWHHHNTKEVFPLPAGWAPYRTTIATERDDATLPRAVMFRDSFAAQLAPFLSEGFQRIIYLWDYNFDHGLVERERPDVVIQEMVERCLMGPLPTDY
jgi:alginate O-acetyltransferase complex protein AlgJ